MLIDWECPNKSCELHGQRKALGPGTRLVTWTCVQCKTPLVASSVRSN